VRAVTAAVVYHELRKAREGGGAAAGDAVAP